VLLHLGLVELPTVVYVHSINNPDIIYSTRLKINGWKHRAKNLGNKYAFGC
jgi:hypothetical protein